MFTSKFVLVAALPIASLVGAAAPSSLAAASPRLTAGATLTVPGEYPTIQAALNAAASGDTIDVAPGNYPEKIDFGGKNVKLVGTAGATTTEIEPLGGGTVVTIGPLGTIQGFTISGGFAEFGGGMWVSGAGTVVKQDVFYANTEMIGGLGAAIFGGDASPIVEQDVFQANHCDDTQFGFGVVSFVNLSSPRFDNDVFDDNNCRAVSLALSRGSDPVVVNDTIVRNAGGLFIDDYAATAGQVFRNDIVVDNTVGVQSDSKGQNYSFDHNDVYGNTTDYGGLPDQTGLNGNISADPLFAGSLADDFELSSGSPAIGVGSPVDAPTVDFNGDPRPPGSIDLGAFQTQPSISAQLAGLREAVDGLHGGHALARLVTGAEQAFEIGDIPAACQDIKKFVFLEHRVGGSTIPRSVRTQLADAARRIESDLAC